MFCLAVNEPLHQVEEGHDHRINKASVMAQSPLTALKPETNETGLIAKSLKYVSAFLFQAIPSMRSSNNSQPPTPNPTLIQMCGRTVKKSKIHQK